MPTLKYEVYWNIRLKCWSVRMNRKVIGHYKQLVLQGCTFHVSERGRQRVLRERRKNVHATVRGYGLCWQEAEKYDPMGGLLDGPGVVVSYNPYKGPTFTTDYGLSVTAAEHVIFRADGKLRVNGIAATLPAANAA